MNYSPSLYAHVINGCILLASVLFLGLYFSKIISGDPYKILVLLLLFSIAIGIHGLSHLGLESAYNYNPFKLLV